MPVISLDERRAQRDGDSSNPKHDFLTFSEVATRTRLCEKTLRNLMALGAGPKVVRLGRRILIRREDYDTWRAALPACVYNNKSEV